MKQNLRFGLPFGRPAALKISTMLLKYPTLGAFFHVFTIETNCIALKKLHFARNDYTVTAVLSELKDYLLHFSLRYIAVFAHFYKTFQVKGHRNVWKFWFWSPPPPSHFDFGDIRREGN